MPLTVIQHYSDWVCTAVMSNDVMKDLRSAWMALLSGVVIFSLSALGWRYFRELLLSVSAALGWRYFRELLLSGVVTFGFSSAWMALLSEVVTFGFGSACIGVTFWSGYCWLTF